MKSWQMTLILLAIACTLLGMFYIGYYAEHPTPEQPTYYPMTGIVTNVDHDLDIVTFKDCTGHLWDFYGAEDWEEGDICSCIMNDMGTPSIIDDEIIGEPKYSGRFEMWGY